jgi:hypothetical protein
MDDCRLTVERFATALFQSSIDNRNRKTFRVDFPQILTHFSRAGFFAWCVGGYLRGVLWGKEIPTLKEKRLPTLF